jgi:hypothetical protein
MKVQPIIANYSPLTNFKGNKKQRNYLHLVGEEGARLAYHHGKKKGGQKKMNNEQRWDVNNENNCKG